MEQLQVDFTFRPLVWSDGTPLSALDSVYSFDVAADPTLTTGKLKTGTTESYEATGDLTVRWTGLPGFLDDGYFTNVWQPMPAHALSRFAAGELAAMEEVTSTPLSSGPYVIEEWLADGSVRLTANSHYYRRQAGLPLIPAVTLKFGSVDAFLEAEAGCDVIAGEAIGAHNLQALREAGQLDGWEIIASPGNVYEQIALGILPTSEYRESRPEWFGDVRVRQALLQCTDRQAMVEELTGGEGVIMNTLTPPEHPLTPPDLQAWAYDPVRANELLDEAGYKDYAGDGRRQDVQSGVPMTITLGTNSESGLRQRINELFQENMSACGIPVVLYERPAGTWFGPGPDGPLFGRQFDLASFAWLGHVNPDCSIFATKNIPGPRSFDFGGWSAPNVAGWSNEAYDAACAEAELALPGGEGYGDAVREALRLLNDELPALPLFTSFKAVAVRPGVRNVQPDAAQPSALWNIAEWDVVE